MKSIRIDLKERSYDITVGRGILGEIDKYFDLERKVFIVTDTGVPREYSETVKALCRDAIIYTVKEGEGAKSLDVLGDVLEEMSKFGMTRADTAIAVGGGVVGDLTGFASSVYMRGIDFYNVPTTLLSEVDSSIGGKTAINLGGVKNIVGAFYQPRGVLIDTNTLSTLPKRQIAAGLAEAVKMAVTSDEELFSLFENLSYDEILADIETVILRSLGIKKRIVEEDEREGGLRRVLNFGHTLGHAIEAVGGGELYHGECVALGMLPTSGEGVRGRLEKVLKKLGLPTEYKELSDDILGKIEHDKKRSGDKIAVVTSDKIGSFSIKDIHINELKDMLSSSFREEEK